MLRVTYFSILYACIRNKGKSGSASTGELPSLWNGRLVEEGEELSRHLLPAPDDGHPIKENLVRVGSGAVAEDVDDSRPSRLFRAVGEGPVDHQRMMEGRVSLLQLDGDWVRETLELRRRQH